MCLGAEGILLPWNDLSADTQRFAYCVGQLGRRCIDDLAMDLVRPTCVVLDATCYFREILVESYRIWLAWTESAQVLVKLARLTIIPCINRRQQLLVLLNKLAKLVHQISTV